MANIVLFHSDCFDGTTAAWVAMKALMPETTYFYPCKHGDPPPDAMFKEDSEVYILDFSFSREIMEGIHSKVKSLIVLDHHRTAEEDCKGLPYCIFDMNKSGAGLAWDYFFPDKPRVKLVDYVEDRDLWNFKLPHSAEIYIWLATYEKNYLKYDTVATLLEWKFDQCVGEGTAILGYHKQKIDEICASPMWEYIGSHSVPVVNCPYQFGSDAAHKLLQLYPEVPFAAYFLVDRDHKYKYGLRGRNSDDFDVSEIAKEYGGGGHKKAAGFTTDNILFP